MSVQWTLFALRITRLRNSTKDIVCCGRAIKRAGIDNCQQNKHLTSPLGYYNMEVETNMVNKKQTTVNVSMAEYKRLKRLDARQNKMKPLVLQLAAYFYSKKVEYKK